MASFARLAAGQSALCRHRPARELGSWPTARFEGRAVGRRSSAEGGSLSNRAGATVIAKVARPSGRHDGPTSAYQPTQRRRVGMKKNQSVSDIEQHRLAENVGVLADAAAGAMSLAMEKSPAVASESPHLAGAELI